MVMNQDKESSQTGQHRPDRASWKRIVCKYQNPSASKAVWQIVNTLGPYALLWCLMYYTWAVSPWLAFPLAVLAGALLVRVFIIFHDCGHGSFFNSPAANDVWGFLSGLQTFPPYYLSREEHSLHHPTSSALTRCGASPALPLPVP